MRSVMMHSFSQVPSTSIPRAQFNRNHGHKTTLDVNQLVPFFIDEALPGDTFKLKANIFARLNTPIVPIMDNMFMDTFFFAVPIRLIWDNWQKFNGEQTNPGDSIDYTLPVMTSPGGGYTNMSLHDYMGIPTLVAGLEHHSLFHRAYNLIWNEWFRDENLQNSVVVDKDDGPDDPADYVLLKRGKRHDYFTSCLPWPQKGDSVDIPLGTVAPVITDGTAIALEGAASVENNIRIQTNANLNWGTGSTATSVDAIFGSNTGLQADLSAATAATINQLRQGFQVQRLLEKDARGGTRYTEILRNHFGVISPDSRVQRPEYLGGGSQIINVTPIAQTSSTDVTTPQGNLAAMGTVTINGHGFAKSFTEHCLVIGLVNVRADLTYQQGLNRMFSRQTRYDFYWPSLAHLGEQAVLNKEIYADASANDDLVFGYQERFAEYRYKPSLITGKLRSNDPQSLDSWHLSQEFGSLPVLNSSFIEENTPIDRCVAVTTEPDFKFDSYIELNCVRPMPLYSVPGLIDHF